MLDKEIVRELMEGKLDQPTKLFASMESARDIAIIVSAFANTSGGYLFFGVQHTLGVNRIVGLAQDFKLDTIIQDIPELFDVIPDYEYSWIKIQNERPIFVMKVNKSKEAILVQGNRYEMHENEIVKVEEKKVRDYTKVFIVHGRDNEAKQEVARFIERLGLEAIILHEQVSRSYTIIEKIEEYSNVGYAVVIYTPCDEGRLKDEKEFRSRARQNVVFEHGFLMGKIGRKNVCALVKGDIETPNDISGVVYENMDSSGAWKLCIAKELKAAGYQIDLNSII